MEYRDMKVEGHVFTAEMQRRAAECFLDAIRQYRRSRPSSLMVSLIIRGGFPSDFAGKAADRLMRKMKRNGLIVRDLITRGWNLGREARR